MLSIFTKKTTKIINVDFAKSVTNVQNVSD